MDAPAHTRRAELLGTTVRRLLRRGARTKISKALAKIRPEDVAVMLRGFTPGEQIGVFQVLGADFPEAATDVILELDPTSRLTILEQLSPASVAKLLDEAAVDDAVFILDALPDELKEKVLEIVDLEERFAEVQVHLTYADDTAGRIMDSELAAVAEDATASEAIDAVRKLARDVEMIAYLYVVDREGRLRGVATLRQLLLAEPTATLSEIMNSAVIKVDVDTDQEEVAQLAARYDLLAIPVTDDDGVLKGIVTVDDILDVFKEEATEDFFRLAGTSEEELVYQDRPLKVAGIRLPWIVFNLFGLMIAGFLTTLFQETFQLALLIGFIPVVMGMAGNIGSQTSTISVRGLATGRLVLGEGRVRRFLWQQLKVGILLAVICSSLVSGAAWAFSQSPKLVLAVGTSLLLTVLIASVSGVMVPVLFRRLGFDPAVASGPLVTTANDALGVFIYFALASFFFRILTG